jgi:hypothetical protein
MSIWHIALFLSLFWSESCCPFGHNNCKKAQCTSLAKLLFALLKMQDRKYLMHFRSDRYSCLEEKIPRRGKEVILLKNVILLKKGRINLPLTLS